MTYLTKRAFLGSSLAWAAVPALAASKPRWHTGDGEFVAGGADVVAYFGLAYRVPGVDGDTAFATTWNGARWRFRNAENLALFQADPEKYAPKFGGYCAYALAKGSLAPTDKNAWNVYEGALYLNYSRSIRGKWASKAAQYIQDAQGHWPGILSAG